MRAAPRVYFQRVVNRKTLEELTLACVEEKQLPLCQFTDTRSQLSETGCRHCLTALWGGCKMKLEVMAVCVCVHVRACACVCARVSPCMWLTGRVRLLFLNCCACCLTRVYLQADCRRQMEEALCDLICPEHLRMFLSRANRSGCLPLLASASERQPLSTWICESDTCTGRGWDLGKGTEISVYFIPPQHGSPDVFVS